MRPQARGPAGIQAGSTFITLSQFIHALLGARIARKPLTKATFASVLLPKGVESNAFVVLYQSEVVIFTAESITDPFLDSST